MEGTGFALTILAIGIIGLAYIGITVTTYEKGLEVKRVNYSITKGEIK